MLAACLARRSREDEAAHPVVRENGPANRPVPTGAGVAFSAAGRARGGDPSSTGTSHSSLPHRQELTRIMRVTAAAQEHSEDGYTGSRSAFRSNPAYALNGTMNRPGSAEALGGRAMPRHATPVPGFGRPTGALPTMSRCRSG